MQNTEEIIIPKKKKRKNRWGFIYLFLFVFISALTGILYLVKSYSPDVDVEIGNAEPIALNESDIDVEIKSVDERLKWIQMEDEMPTVALREPEIQSKEDTKKTEKEEKKKEQEPPKPTISEIKKNRPDFREIPTATPSAPVPPKYTRTKVYLGSYSTLEEAMSVQNNVAANEPSVSPFVKNINNSYIVQLGSFSEKERADALISKMKAKGYNPKVKYEN